MLTKIRVKNFRSIVDSGWLELRALTLLVGQNASGKSSLLRVLPLLRQSIEKPTASPMLWFGPLVDFGSFHEVANHRALERGEPVTFGFRFHLPASTFQVYPESPITKDDIDIEVNIHLQKARSGVSALLDRCDLAVTFSSDPTWTDHINITFSANQAKVASIEVNSVAVINEAAEIHFAISGSLLPLLSKTASRRWVGRTRYYPYAVSDIALHDILKLVANIVHSRVKESTVNDLAHALPLAPPAQFRELISRSMGLIGKNLNSWDFGINKQSTETIEQLRVLALANAVPVFLWQCTHQLIEFSQGISYMGPIRATADRFYRLQDLAVEELDHRGANLPMLLNSLSVRDIRAFSEWCGENLGFDVTVNKIPGHVSVQVQSKLSKTPVNITDTGLGISQVLPIVLQMWLAVHERRSRLWRQTTALVMEQPELHLHPQLQSEIGKVIVASAARQRVGPRMNLQPRVFVETHSEAIVNMIGAAVRNDELQPGDVQILVFELNQLDGQTEIRRAHFDERGILINWPYGFLAP